MKAKKIIATAIALVMVMSLSTVALAAAGDAYSGRVSSVNVSLISLASGDPASGTSQNEPEEDEWQPPNPDTEWVASFDETWSGSGDLVLTHDVPKGAGDFEFIWIACGPKEYGGNPLTGETWSWYSSYAIVDSQYYTITIVNGVATITIKASYLEYEYSEGAFTDGGFDIDVYYKNDKGVYYVVTLPVVKSASTTKTPTTNWSGYENLITTAAVGATAAINIPSGASTILPVNILQAAKENDVTLQISLPSGLTIVIDPATITDDAQAIDLNVDIQAINAATTINNTQIPANSIVIAPSAHGQFGFTMSFTLTAEQLASAGLSASDVKIFHVADDGTVTQAGSVTVNSDGSVTVSISHASIYILLDDASGLDINAAPRTNASSNMIVLLIILTASGTLTTVSAIVLKKKNART